MISHPALNALLNGTAAAFLLIGYVLIRNGNRAAHKRAMIAAFSCSTLFLISYLIYHFNVGSVKFQGQGIVRAIYFALLLSHTILAAVIVPMVLITLSRGLREQFDRHRRIARWTLPLWLYVSITGVVIYFMLYRL